MLFRYKTISPIKTAGPSHRLTVHRTRSSPFSPITKVTLLYALDINIAQLRYLVAVIDCGTTQGAAHELHVAQPTISRAVSALETELGITLFERTGRRLVPTDVAHDVVAVARRVCADVDRIGDLARQQDAFTIAATPNTEALVTTAIIDAHLCGLQTARFVFAPAYSRGETERLVKAGSADIGFIVGPTESRLRSRRLCELELVLVAHRKMGLIDPVPIEDLSDMRIVLPSTGSERRVEVDEFFAKHGIVPKDVFESDNRTAWLSAAASGHAVAMHFVIKKQFLNRGLQHYSLAPSIRTGLNAVSVRQPPAAIGSVLDALTDHAAALTESIPVAAVS